MGSTSARLLFGGLYYLLPNLSNLSVITPAAHGHSPAPQLCCCHRLVRALLCDSGTGSSRKYSVGATSNDTIIR